jgi:hypothetical protein
MTKNKIAVAISAALLTVGVSAPVSAHDLIGGAVVGQGKTDVFRTTCFPWGGSTATTEAGPKITYAATPAITPPDTSGAARGFRFAVNLYPSGNVLKNDTSTGVDNTVTTTTATISATVGFTKTGNISSGKTTSDPNNYLPAVPEPNWATVSQTAAGTPWHNTTSEPDFTSSGISPTGWSAGYFLDNGVGTGDGDYIISIENTTAGTGTTATSSVAGYDFLGHCQNAPTLGAATSVHTGQGTWFVPSTTSGAGTSLYTPGNDFDQLIDN